MEILHIFVLNPAAGHRDQTTQLRMIIDTLCLKLGLEYKILHTRHKGEASALCADFAGAHPDRICRFYSCGGDGTLNEVVSGVLDAENAQVACFACGTGNDLIKIFDHPDYFRDMARVISGQAVPLDAMRISCDGIRRGALNICSAGIDARVADWVGRNKRRLPFGGKVIYDLSLARAFFSRLSRSYQVTIDGKTYDGEYAILVAASGRFYGGGYYAVPEAEPDDGLLDFLLVKKVSHFQLLRLIGKYQSGRHQEFSELTVYARGREMRLKTQTPEPVNYDGEILAGQDVQISLCPGKISFVLPEGCEIIHDARAFESISEKNKVNTRKQSKNFV
jgi:diacylglycerol kinase (ATP)